MRFWDMSYAAQWGETNGSTDSQGAGKILVHCITNYVTAGIAPTCCWLAGVPIMADDLAEAASPPGAMPWSSTWAPHAGTLPAMAAAGKQANQLGHPVVLDPVGVGASAGEQRSSFWERFSSPHPGNISEESSFAYPLPGQGVDAGAVDAVTEETIPRVALAQQLWAKTRGGSGHYWGH